MYIGIRNRAFIKQVQCLRRMYTGHLKKSAKGVANVSKSVLFHPGEGGSVSHTTQDEKSWYRLSYIPACVSFNPFVVKMDLSYLKYTDAREE